MHTLAGRVQVRRTAGDRDRLQAAFEPFFDRRDVLIMPTLAWPCPPARRWGERSWLRSVVASLRFAPMTGVWNMVGFAAASVPCPPTGGLSGSVQLVAAPGGESLRRDQEGIASGANNAIRELGGVFGIAVLGAVFSAHGSYLSGSAFVAGLVPAVWVGGAAVAVACAAALLLPRMRRATSGSPAAQQAHELEMVS
jgi:Amidase